jgi:hypothetical protein
MGDDCYAPQQSWTHPRMDTFHMLDDMRITSYALRYYVNPPEANCPSVFPVEPTTRIQRNNGDSWPQQQWRTDVETDLKGINRFGNRVRCDFKLYNPDTNKYNNTPLQHAQDSSFPMKFNRLDNGPCTLRSTGWNRWQPLFHDPQKTFEQPFDYFIPSRDVDKERCAAFPRRPPPKTETDLPPYNPMADKSKYAKAQPAGTVQAAF